MNHTLMATVNQAVPSELFAGGLFSILWLALIVWSLYWKGIALWKAARLYDRNWFILLLIVNIFGIIEIFYIYRIAKQKENKIRADLETKKETN